MKAADTAAKTLQLCFLCGVGSYCCQAHCDAHWARHGSLCSELRGGPGSVPNLYNACLNGKLEELTKMLQQRPRLDVNWATPDTGTTAAYVAAREGHDTCLSLLRQHSADLSKPRKEGGWAPIHATCWHGRYTCLMTLCLDQGVDVNLRIADTAGQTPAMLCCSNGMVKCLAVLLDRQPDLTLVNGNGHTAAHKACVYNQVKCLQLLIKRGCVDIAGQDRYGFTLLDVARMYGHRDCVDLLLENGAVGMREKKIKPMTEAEKVCICIMPSLRIIIIS